MEGWNDVDCFDNEEDEVLERTSARLQTDYAKNGEPKTIANSNRTLPDLTLIGPAENASESSSAQVSENRVLDSAPPQKQFSPSVHLLYGTLFDRLPDAGAQWAEDHLKLGIPYREVVRSAINAGGAKSEFRNSIPTDQNEIMPFLFERVLGRPDRPTPEELAPWNEILRTKGVDHVINLLLNLPEFEARFPSKRTDILVSDVIKHFNSMSSYTQKIPYLTGVLETSPAAFESFMRTLSPQDQQSVIRLIKEDLRNQLTKRFDERTLALFVRLAPYWDEKDVDTLVRGLSSEKKECLIKGLPELLANVDARSIPENIRALLATRLIHNVRTDPYPADPVWRLDALKVIALFPEVLTTHQVRELERYARFPNVPTTVPADPRAVIDIFSSGLTPEQRLQARNLCGQIFANVRRCAPPAGMDAPARERWLERLKEAEQASEKMRKPVSLEVAVSKIKFGDLKLTPNDQLRDQLQQIENKHGRDKVNNINANIDLVNALPPAVRAQAMGWTNFNEDQRKALGWRNEPAPEHKAEMDWDNLSPLQKENWRWQNCRVDARQVLGQLLPEGGFDESPNAVLANDREIYRRLGEANSRWKDELSTQRLYELKREREQALAQLTKSTNESSSAAKLDNIWGNGRDVGLSETQKGLINRIHLLDREIAKQEALSAELRNQQSAVEVAWCAKMYKECLLVGDKENAAAIALNLVKKYGPAMKDAAPDIWNDLTGPGRLVDSGSLFKTGLPDFPTHGKEIPSYDRGVQGFNQALGLEANPSGEKFGLIHLAKDKADYDVLKSYMFGRLDTDPVYNKINQSYQRAAAAAGELKDLMRAAQKGTVYKDYVHHAQVKANALKTAINEVTEEDLRALRIRIAKMEEAARGLPVDSDVRCALNAKINAEKKLLEFFNQKEQLNVLIDPALKGGLAESTLGKWFSDNLPTILAVVAATAVAVTTFGAGAPISVGLVVAVTGVAAQEVSAELLYQINRDGYTGVGDYYNRGSRAGDWWRSLEDTILNKSDLDVIKECVTKVAAPYAKQVVRDWLLFLATAGIVSRFCVKGATTEGCLAQLFKAPLPNLRQIAYQAQRAEALAKGDSVGAVFLRNQLSRLGNEFLVNLGMSGVGIVAEEAAAEAIGPEKIKAAGEDAEFGLSFAVSTSIALGQGALHGRILAGAKMENSHMLKFKLAPGVNEAAFIQHMRQQGLDVRPTKPGVWEVRPFGAPTNFKPITMENEDVAARGEGKPPAEVEPPGGLKQEPRPKYEGDTIVGEEFFWPTQKGEKVAADLHAFTEKFMAKDFDGALNLAKADLPPEGTPKITRQEVIFDGNAEALVAQMRTTAKVEPPAGGEVKITVARPVVELEVVNPNGKPNEKIKVKVDMLTGEPISEIKSGNPLKPVVEQAYAQFAKSNADAIATVRSAQESLARSLATVEHHDVVWNGDARFMMEQMSGVAKVEVEGSTVKMRLPRPVVEVEIQTPSGVQKVKVDMLTGQPIEPATSHRQTQIEQAYKKFAHDNAEAINRIKAEQALILMEENIFHHRHGKDDNTPMSPTYAKFVEQCFPNDPGYTDGFRNGQKRSKATIEQEAMFALHDAGWSVEALRHHFGNHHSSVREPVFKFLEAQAALKKLPPQVAEGVTKLLNDSNTLPETRRQIYEMLPEIIRQYGNGNELVGKIQKLRDVMPSLSGMGGTAADIAATIKALKSAHPELSSDPMFCSMVDREIGRRLLEDRSLFESNGFQDRMKLLSETLKGLNLPADGSIQQALRTRINRSLETNKPASELPMERMRAIANRFDLNDAVTAINNYRVKPPKGMQVDGVEVIDAFVEGNPAFKDARADFDKMISRLRDNTYNNPNELVENFGKKKSGKPICGGVAVGNVGGKPVTELSRFVVDVGGNDYRMVVDVDYSTKPKPTVHVVWAGTHSQYDRVNVGTMPKNY